jgi:multidrug resistance efflux pump
MTWTNRFKLLGGMMVVIAIVAASTLILNRRESQVASTSASISAVSYSVGSDYAGTVTKQSVKEGDRVKKGDRLLTIRSTSLMTYISTSPLRIKVSRPARPTR